MASVMRYRGGNVRYQAFPTAQDAAVAHAIEVGDLVYLDTGIAYSAKHLADGGSAADNRALFAAAFAGVAVQKIGLQTGETIALGLTADPGWVLVAISGEFEFECASTAFAPGDLVGVYSGGSAVPDNCYPQKVAKVTAYKEAIGVAVVPYSALTPGSATPSNQTKIVVNIRPISTHDQVVYGSGQ